MAQKYNKIEYLVAFKTQRENELNELSIRCLTDFSKGL